MNLKGTKKVVVSACLLGRRCRYDGRSKANTQIQEMLNHFEASGGEVAVVCPEELGKLGTPRPAAQLEGGDGEAVLLRKAQVRTVAKGLDVTESFIEGAEKAATMAEGAEVGLLKARSPSCGCAFTRIDGEVTAGQGVFAALLRRQDLTLFSEEDVARKTIV
jgi:uncharacterized protein YbbK (DUF523 family)